jgi:excisionase family DNA binding protein
LFDSQIENEVSTMKSTTAARLRQDAAQQADSVLTLIEASARLKVSERTLWQLAKDNEVPHFKVGRQYRFLVSELDAWAISQCKRGGE